MKKFGTKSMISDGWSDYNYFTLIIKNIKDKLSLICRLDKWYHIAVVKTGKKRIIYKNGIPLITQDSYLSIPDSNDFKFDKGDFTIDFWIRLGIKIRNWSLTAKLNLMNYIY